MRRLFVLFGLVAVAALLVALGSPTSAAPAASAENFRATLSLTATIEQDCCSGDTLVALRGEGVVPMIGRATVSGFIHDSSGVLGEDGFFFHQFFLQSRADNGRFLNIEGFDIWPLSTHAPLSEWRWDASGFGFTGSGTYETSEPIYSFEGFDPVILIEDGEVITLTISGTLHPDRA